MPKRTDPDQLGLFGPAETVAGAGPEREPPRFLEGALPDQAARDRVTRDLETNLLVEAGAGSGKTTALVDRMVALVATGTARAEEVAAVTFTRKAAAELRQRFQTALEARLAAARADERPEVVERLEAALGAIDRLFIGTIHSFCARLLRERPVEAGVDPGFEELMGPEEVRQRKGFWRGHLERVAANGDPGLAGLADVGLSPSQLEGLFEELVANPDVSFPADPVDPPRDEDVAAVRARLDRLLDRARELLPEEPAERGWDGLQSRARRLLFLRRVVDWHDTREFLEHLGEEFWGRSYKVVQNRWPDGPAAKALCEEWGALRDGLAASVLDRWWAHRYPLALDFARRAADAFEEERRRTGRLNFQDLLVLAARLLRTHPRAREELGLRYRRLLVDEFQDTDPVQAEVLLLLASPPDGRPWQQVTPRPGALFVVGDPKQSIYRFRRADIAVYNLVRERFQRFGVVLELVANFRSLPAIGALVDGVFDDRLPPAATPYQAAFAPLRTRRLPVPDPGLGAGPEIAQYRIDPAGSSYAAAAADGAARLGPWIRQQIDRGRRPGDFLILARQKAELATYARTLEAWRVPVQVTGAGVDRTEELRELLVLLESLADPSDPVRAVAVLVGLLFGLDHDQLIDWALVDDGRRFDLTLPRPDDATPVGRALHTLHGWWQRSRREPADVLVGRIVDETGLVPLAASRELGALRAGSLLFALDALRVAALAGDTSIAAATASLRTALEADEAEAPLEPVRAGAVRVMTLHQAKGLEAPVVVLAHPVGGTDHPVTRHIQRGDDGSAVGHLVIQEKERYRTRIIARPAGWEAKEAEERRFEAAEADRLLYVAATRAEDQLVVARNPGADDRSPWAGLYPWLDRHGGELAIAPEAPPEPEPVSVDSRELARRAAALREERSDRAAPGYLVGTATAVAKAEAAAEAAEGSWAGALPDPRDGPDPEYRGRSWGSAVHGALDAAARGVAGPELRRICRSLLLELERPTKGAEPVELEELVAVVETVRASALWERARAADRTLSEVPFTWHHADSGLVGAEPGAPADRPRLLEGVVDLAFREPGGWVIVDYKTDVGTDPGYPARVRTYRRQVELYAAAWEAITGEPVGERVLFFTARPDQPLRW